MPRVTADYVPAYRLHKSSGQAIVTLSARDYLLGTYGTPESKVRYHELVAQWIAAGRKPFGPNAVRAANPFTSATLTVATLVAAHDRHARGYYVNADGTNTSEVGNFAAATAPLVELFGTLAVDAFTPTCLKAVRSRMIAKGWARTLINKQVNRLRCIWKWAASEELVPALVHQTLTTLAPLKRGRTDANESEPVRPVPLANVAAVEPHVAPPVWALVQLQRFTGARGGELFKLRAVDIDTTADVWTYTPAAHKTAHFGHKRTIYFGPRSQAILRPFMAGRAVDAYLFNPREGNAVRKATLATAGKSRRPNQMPNARKSARVVGEHYNRESYRRAIARGCTLAKCDQWHPHQLRHTAATLWRKNYGPEAALTMLGDRTTRMVDVYAEKDQGTATKIAAEIG